MTETFPEEIIASLQHALDEDVGSGDATTNNIVPGDAALQAQIIAKQDGVVAGLDVAEKVFLLVDDQVTFSTHVSEGSAVEKGSVLADVAGPARALLTGERTALNFLGRMSGIASLTRQFVDAVSGTKATILDTRKT